MPPQHDNRRSGPQTGALSWHPLLTWGPAIAIMVLIYSLSSQPELGGPGLFVGVFAEIFGGTTLHLALIPIATALDAHADVLGHLAEYAILAVAVKWALDRQWPWMKHLLLGFLLAWVISVLYGISDEWHQSFVIGRHSDPVDVFVDGVGAAGALITLFMLERIGSHD